MLDIIVIGGGGHARAVISVLKRTQIYNILGFTDLDIRVEQLGIPFLGEDIILYELQQEYPDCLAVIGIGAVDRNSFVKRSKIIQKISDLNFKFPPIISQNAILNEEVKIGQGSVVMDGVVINCETKIGDYAIINTSCSIDHDSTIGDLSHIAPGVTLSGGVNIGKMVLVGAGSVVIENTKIADNSIIGAGSVVIRDCETSGIYIGNPAKRVK